MAQAAEASRECHLLTRLPPELRLRIYEQLYDRTVNPIFYLTVRSRLLRAGASSPLYQPPRNYAALLRTCKTINNEVHSIFYKSLSPSMLIYAFSREYKNYDDFGSLHTSSLLKFVRETDLHFWVVSIRTINVFLLQVKGLAEALKDNQKLKISSLDFSPPAVGLESETRRIVKLRCVHAIASLSQFGIRGQAAEQLYRRLLDEIDERELPKPM